MNDMPTKRQVILGTLARFGREQILKEWGPDSCIASTALAIDILKHYGIKAEAFPCTVMVFNAVNNQKIKEIGRLPNAEESRAWQDDGGWSVGVGFGSKGMAENKWPGHLVVIVDDEILLDLSIDQATRPKHKMYLQAGGGGIPNFQEFYSGKEVYVAEANDCLLIYERKDQDAYKKSPDWTERQRRERVLLFTIQEIDDQLLQLENCINDI